MTRRWALQDDRSSIEIAHVSPPASAASRNPVPSQPGSRRRQEAGMLRSVTLQNCARLAASNAQVWRPTLLWKISLLPAVSGYRAARTSNRVSSSASKSGVSALAVFLCNRRGLCVRLFQHAANGQRCRSAYRSRLREACRRLCAWSTAQSGRKRNPRPSLPRQDRRRRACRLCRLES